MFDVVSGYTCGFNAGGFHGSARYEAFAGQDFNFDPLGLSVKCDTGQQKRPVLCWVGASTLADDWCYIELVMFHDSMMSSYFFLFIEGWISHVGEFMVPK